MSLQEHEGGVPERSATPALANRRGAPAAAVEVDAHEPLGHHPGLDGLRAVAALLVVLLHARVPGFENGWIGVDIFFTLSGFLITAILLSSIARHGTPRFRSFYLRRALRLLPAYVAVVVAAVVCDFFVDVGGTLKGALFSALYIANWAAGAGVGLGSLEHTWSLSIEEQFYLVWPVLLLLLVRSCARRGTSALAVVLLVTLLLQASSVAAVAWGISEHVVWNATPARSVQLLAGAVLALGLVGLHRRVRPGRGAKVAGGLGLLGLLGYQLLPQFSFPVLVAFTWPAVSVLTCLVIGSVVVGGGPVDRVLSTNTMVSIGRVSYGLYLWHYLIFTTLDARLGLDEWRVRLFGLALTAVVVAASYVVVERPFLRLKDRVGG